MNANHSYKLRQQPTTPPPSESALLKRLLVRGSQLGARLWRNQVGRYRLARPECRECQSRGRVLTSGFGVGSSDLIGFRTVTVTPAMVGQRLAVLVCLEVKGPKTPTTDAQIDFLSTMQQCGAVAYIVRSIEDLERVLA